MRINKLIKAINRNKVYQEDKRGQDVTVISPSRLLQRPQLGEVTKLTSRVINEHDQDDIDC